MPCHACTDKGKRGWKWGSKGKCYTGPGAKVKCERQGRAAFAGGYRGGILLPVCLLVLSVTIGFWIGFLFVMHNN
jgi:hypothetical protein